MYLVLSLLTMRPCFLNDAERALVTSMSFSKDVAVRTTSSANRRWLSLVMSVSPEAMSQSRDDVFLVELIGDVSVS